MISVIIPTKNRPHYLREAVDSALAQKDCELEVIVVNDGAQLGFAFSDPRVRVLDNQQRGAVPARNLGVGEARGGIIAWLDDDDVWTDPDHLSRAASALKEKCDFFFADGTFIFADGGVDQAFARDADAATLAHDNTILISAICYRASLHKELGLFDPALPYYADWDWYLRVARAGFRLKRYAQSVVNIRVHAQNESGELRAEARRANLDLLSAKHGLGHIPLKNHTDFAT